MWDVLDGKGPKWRNGEARCSRVTIGGTSLLVRFVVTDRATGKAWWQYGAATEGAETAAAKRMSDDQLRDRIAALRASDIFTST